MGSCQFTPFVECEKALKSPSASAVAGPPTSSGKVQGTGSADAILHIGEQLDRETDSWVHFHLLVAAELREGAMVRCFEFKAMVLSRTKTVLTPPIGC